MSKHVSSSGDDTSASRRDAVTESFSTQDAADGGTWVPSQGSTDGGAAEGAVKDVAKDPATAPVPDEGQDGGRSGAASGSHKEPSTERAEHAAADATASAARAAVAGNSTSDTRLERSWATPDAQNAATIGVGGSASDAAKKARAKARQPWYRRRVVVGAAGVALLAGTFAAGWGTNELLDHDSDARGSHAQQEPGNGQGGPGGQMPGGGPGGGQGGPGGQMPGGGPGGGQGGPGGQMPGGGPGGGQGGSGGQNGQGGPGGGSGGAGRTTPNGDAPGGSGSGEGNQKGGSDSSGVLQQQDATPSTQG